MTRASTAAAAFVLAVLVTCGGCGGNEPRPRSTDEAFREIQTYEAQAADAHAIVSDTSRSCGETCRAPTQLCQASVRACAVAHEIYDADALARCRRLEEMCAASRAEAGQRCGCRARVAQRAGGR